MMAPRGCRVVVAVAWFAVAGMCGTARAQTTNVFWPELQVQHWFNEHRSSAIGMIAAGNNRDADISSQLQEGLTFEHQFTSFFLGRVGYRHASSTNGGPFFENRALI